MEHAARLLLERGHTVDICYTSVLKRAIRSSWILLRELHQVYRPMIKSYHLNERMYGALEGLSKPGLAKEVGEELVQKWRAGLIERPPPVSDAHLQKIQRERKYSRLDSALIPKTESLQDTIDRVTPLWDEQIYPDLCAGRNVLIVAHGNSIRGIVKKIDDITTEDIQKVGIPNGIPLVYKFDAEMKPLPQRKAVPPLTGEYLEKKGLLRAALEREDERFKRVEGYSLSSSSLAEQQPAGEHSLEGGRNYFLEGGVGWHDLNASSTYYQPTQSFAIQSLTILEQKRRLFEAVDPQAQAQSEDKDKDKEKHASPPSSTKDVGAKQASPPPAATTPTPAATPSSSSVMPSTALGTWHPVTLKNGHVARPLLVIIRHGKTEHNKLGLFTGWEDVQLAVEGRQEAAKAGRLLQRHGIEFDVVYTSWLSRAIETAWLVLNELDSMWLPIVKTWRLNERHYGALTGLSKKMIRQKHGQEQFLKWRRGFDTVPPPASSFSHAYPGNDDRYVKYCTDINVSPFETVVRSLAHGRLEVHRQFPKSESLKMCMERTIPFFRDVIVPGSLSKGRSVLIASSENAIRGLLMHLCDIPINRIHEVEIPTGLPMVYDHELRRIRLLDDDDVPRPMEKYDFGSSPELFISPENLESREEEKDRL